MSIQALLTEYGDKYLQALLTTWRLTAISFAAAFLIGVVVTVLRVCPIRPLRLFGDFYVQIFRNIPGPVRRRLLRRSRAEGKKHHQGKQQRRK